MVTANILASTDPKADTGIQLQALSLARAMPSLIVDARRIAASAAAGIHGRRRAGAGDSFWQFRPFTSGEAATRVDWRRSARDGKLFVREREWEAAENVWLWIDRSPSMRYASSLAQCSKLERAVVLGLAAADMLMRGGERAGLFCETPPLASRRIIERLGEAMALSEATTTAIDLPQATPIGPREEIILIGDFIEEPSILEARLRVLASRGGRGHLILIADPVEEVFPFSGETEFEDPQGGPNLRVGDAKAFATNYLNRIAAHREALRQLSTNLGWSFALHRTDRSAVEALYGLMAVLNGNFATTFQKKAG